MQRRSFGHDAVVQHHSVGVKPATGPPVVAFMGRAQEEHSAGDFFEDIGEVLGTHDGCIKRDPAFRAEHIFNHSFAELDGAVVADSDGEALLINFVR